MGASKLPTRQKKSVLQYSDFFLFGTKFHHEKHKRNTQHGSLKNLARLPKEKE